MVASLGVSFACLNASKVTLNFFISTYEIPLSLLLVLTLGIGILVGFIVMLLSHLKFKAKYAREKNKLEVGRKGAISLPSQSMNDIK